jgi:hypothetical protein
MWHHHDVRGHLTLIGQPCITRGSSCLSLRTVQHTTEPAAWQAERMSRCCFTLPNWLLSGRSRRTLRAIPACKTAFGRIHRTDQS